jgi:endonuclease YncB( thermonuclease family)
MTKHNKRLDISEYQSLRDKLRLIPRIPITLIFVLLFWSSSLAVASEIRIVDGDTIIIDREKIRLHGIDAPESSQTCRNGKLVWACGEAATLALRKILDGRKPDCETLARDRYGRSVSRCVIDGIDVGEELVRRGLALAYQKYSADYIAAEDVARSEGYGIFAGEFIPPWEWRRGNRLMEPTVRAGECNIKGNINRNGEKIYHLPGTAFYSRTKISEEKGERWFCSEVEANEAGWRSSRAK